MERSQTPKGKRARERILIAAERLIAERGFYGTSMRDIAAAARLPLATTVYHFAKKEQLYAAILGDIAAALDARLQAAMFERYERDTERTTTAATAAIDALAVALLRWAAEEPGRVKLLLRELLDNSARVARATRLPLAAFLERASALVAARGVAHPEVVVLHLVGAISYFVAAWPTVERIVGTPRAKQISAAYEREVISLARRLIEAGGPGAADLAAARRRTRARGAA